jgi:hypothetical protein
MGGTGCLFSGPTHSDSDSLEIIYGLRSGNSKRCCVLCVTTRGAVFRLIFFLLFIFLRVWRNKAPGNVDYWE